MHKKVFPLCQIKSVTFTTAVNRNFYFLSSAAFVYVQYAKEITAIYMLNAKFLDSNVIATIVDTVKCSY